MFAYCLNNAVGYTDPTGTLAYPGEIHNEVVRRIKEEYGFYSEQRILYKAGGYGRADLISEDGQIWDVKPNKKHHIKAGKKQVKKYAANTWRNHPEIDLQIGGDTIEASSFCYHSGKDTYWVKYWYVGEGVIVYDYYKVDKQSNYNVSGTFFFAGAGLAAAAGIFSGLSRRNVAYSVGY